VRVYELYRFLCGRILFLWPFLLLPLFCAGPDASVLGGNKNVFLCVRLSPIPAKGSAVRLAWFGCSIMAAFGRHVYEYAASRLGFAPLWVPVLYEGPGTGAAFIIPIFIYITLSIFGCYFFFGRATALATGCCCHFCINFIFGLWVCALSFSCRCCLFRINNKYFWLLRLHSINIISRTPTHTHTRTPLASCEPQDSWP